MKKTVNILLMEPKHLLMDLTKKAIQSKPDDFYDLQIVGTAVTAKAGYFELYKHRPHILILDPELADEDGLSFIYHALERMPYLKIMVMTARFQDEQAYLQSGAHAVVQVPIQRASLWRKLDQLIEEVETMGLLNIPDYQSEEDDLAVPAENLFQFDDTEKPAFTPIFEALRRDNEEKEEELKSEQGPHEEIVSPEPSKKETNPLPFTEMEETVDEIETVSVEPNPDDDLMILDDEVPLNLESQPIPAIEKTEIDEQDVLILEEEEPPVLDWELEQQESANKPDKQEQLETPELAIFDPFQWSEDSNEKKNVKESTEVSSNESSPSNDDGSLFSFQKKEAESDIPTESTVEDDNDFPIFQFEVEDFQETGEGASETETIPSEELNFPLFHVEIDEKEKQEQETTKPTTESTISVFKFETEEPVSATTPIENEPFVVRPEVKESPVQRESLFDIEQPEPQEENHLETSVFQKPNEITPSPPVEETATYKEFGSNHAQTQNSLYLAGREYNKSTLKERHAFDSGFYTRNGDFVSMYPPREQFMRNHDENFHQADIEPSNVPFNYPQENQPRSRSEEGLFSSVKKLFKRR